jgi:hypothetical protein
MRLLHHHPFTKAKIVAEKYGVKMPMQQSDALNMRKEVKRDLHLIFQSDALEATGVSLVPEDEYPRHWKTATERHRSGSGVI